MPKINKPENHPLGDLRELKTGLDIDIKSPTGNSKKIIIKRLVDGKHQAKTFIVDMSNCPLSDEEAINQVETLMNLGD